MEEKATNPEILQKCKEIQWHFIGHLQSNKVNKVLNLPNLHIIETVHSIKIADTINKQWEKFRPEPERKLNVYVQINTSGEDEKSGVPPSEASNLANHVLNNCNNLKLQGFMTIGEIGYDTSKGPNPDFLSLIKVRQDFCKEMDLDWKNFEISMGMSSDFEQAVRQIHLKNVPFFTDFFNRLNWEAIIFAWGPTYSVKGRKNNSLSRRSTNLNIM